MDLPFPTMLFFWRAVILGTEARVLGYLYVAEEH